MKSTIRKSKEAKPELRILPKTGKGSVQKCTLPFIWCFILLSRVFNLLFRAFPAGKKMHYLEMEETF